MKKSIISPTALIIVVLFVGLASYLTFMPPDEKAGSLNHQAWEYIETVVNKEIGNSGSLQFPHNGAQYVTHLGNNRYQATSYAEILTKPGEKEKRYFNVTVTYIDNIWAVESLKFAQ